MLFVLCVRLDYLIVMSHFLHHDYIKLAPFFPLFLACIYLKVKTKDSVKYLFSDQNQILLQQIIFVMEGILLVPVPAELGV